MAEQTEETVILNLEVDQSQAVKDLERTETAILNLKQEQSELNKEYKAGTISQQQYVRENLRLQQQIGKEQAQKRSLNKLIETESNSRNAVKARIAQLTKEYDNLNTATEEGILRQQQLQKELSDLNQQVTKTSKSAGLFKDQIGNYPSAFADAAKNIQVAGVSIGDIGAKMTSFLNPATAAVGIITALGAAYSRSTLGAKDLSFAQSQLSAATGLIVNGLAELVTSAEDGEGALTKLLNIALKFSVIGITDALGITDIADRSKELALFAEQLEDLGREEIEIRTRVSERLEENQELLTLINDEEEQLVNKVAASEKINANLVENQKELVDVKQRQLDIVLQQLQADENNEDLQTQVLQISREMAKIQSDTEKRIQGNLRLQADLNRALAEEIRLRNLVARQGGRNVQSSGIDAGNLGLVTPDAGAATTSEEAERTRELIEGQARFELDITEELERGKAKIRKDADLAEQRRLRDVHDARIRAEREQNAALAGVIGEASELFKESTAAYKITASTSTLISTYSSAQKAYESLVGIPVIGPALAAAAAAVAVAQGLQRVGEINGVGFAEGGYTGAGRKHDVAGVVHKGEYVTPKRIVESRSAQPHLHALERMRKGYADGGFVTNTATSDAQQSLLMANAMKRMPAPVVSVVEVTRVQDRINVRETQSRI